LDGSDGGDGADGADGSEVELQKSATHIQWRYVGEATWTNLVALDDLKGSDGSDGAAGDDGSEVELQKGTTHLQWRYVGGTTWTDLVALDDLKGAAGSNGVNGRGYNLTFTSLNIDVSTGTKALILGSMAQPSNSPNMVAALATAYSTGNRVRLSANSSTWIEGQLTVGIPAGGFYAWGLTVTKISGSGTYSTWNVSIAGEPGLDGGVTSYNDLTDLPTLGTAAATASTDYATSAQGTKADSALQPAALTPYRTSSDQDTIDAGKASTTHKSSHATGGTDALTPADIGALSLSASSYIIAKPGDNLATKYAEAKALTPNGAAKSATNRASLIIFPGSYALSAELFIDDEFVDLVGLGSQTQTPIVFVSGNTLNVTANDVRVTGISVGSQNFKIAGSKSLQVFENCVGGDSSFGQGVITSGTFTGCVGGWASFGGSGGNAAGTFVNCRGTTYSFGGGFDASATGIFRGCSTPSGTYSFGGRASQVTGTFENCTGNTFSFFTATNPALGVGATFINCVAPAGSSRAMVPHRLFSCRLTSGTYGPAVPPYNLRITGASLVSSTNLVTKISHGLSIGDIIWFNGSPLGSIQIGTRYHIISDGFTSDAFRFSLSSGGTPVIITVNTFVDVFRASGPMGIMLNCIDANNNIIEGEA
jgi:hypothetical protein